jgi:hypothetical protein
MKTYPAEIESAKEKIAGYTEDYERLKAETTPNEDGISLNPMKIFGVSYTKKAEAGQALLDACKTVASREPVKLGAYRGFDMELSYNAALQAHEITFKGAMRYYRTLGTDLHGNITRVNNLLDSIPELLANARQQLENAQRKLETAKEEVEKPFMLEADLTAKTERLAELDSQLNLDSASSQTEEQAEPEAEMEEDCQASQETNGQEEEYYGLTDEERNGPPAEWHDQPLDDGMTTVPQHHTDRDTADAMNKALQQMLNAPREMDINDESEAPNRFIRDHFIIATIPRHDHSGAEL